MTDFDFDVKEKKSIARGAFARKGGSKSKKCSLPSDILTEAQKRKLNGPCTTVKLGAPMSWDEFKALPNSLAEEYLTDLQDTYGATQKMLAQMFGLSTSYLCKALHTRGLEVHFTKGHGSVDTLLSKQAKWDAFCNGVVGGGGSNLVIESANDQIEPELDEIESPDPREENFVRPTAPRATNLCATFDGFPGLATLESFYRLVGTDKVRVTVSVEVME